MKDSPYRSMADPSRLWLVLGVALTSLCVLSPKWFWIRWGSLPTFTPFTISISIFLVFVVPALAIWPPLRNRVFLTVNRYWPVILTYFAWFAWQFFCDLRGEIPEISIRRTYQGAVFLGGMFFVGLILCTSTKGARFAFRTLLISAIIAAILGIVERVLQQNYTTLLHISFESTEGLSQWRLQSQGFLRAGVYRAQSVFSHPIVFGEFCAMAVPIAIHSMRWEQNKFFQYAGVAALFLLPIAILTSDSRGPIVGFSAAIGAYFFIDIVRTAKGSWLGLIGAATLIIFGILILYAVVPFVQNLVGGRTTEEVGSSISRVSMFMRGVDSIQASPVFGYGDGMSAIKSGFFSTDHVLGTIDCTYLSIPLDFGIPGLVIFLLLCGEALYISFCTAVTRPDENSEGARVIFSLIACALTVQVILSIYDDLAFVYLLIPVLFGLDKRVNLAQRAASAGSLESVRRRLKRF